MGAFGWIMVLFTVLDPDVRELLARDVCGVGLRRRVGLGLVLLLVVQLVRRVGEIVVLAARRLGNGRVVGHAATVPLCGRIFLEHLRSRFGAPSMSPGPKKYLS